MSKATIVRRDYWDGNHRPYVCMWHNAQDQRFDDQTLIENLLSEEDIADGDEFEITITKTGNRPFGERRWILQQPHVYGMETDEQMGKRNTTQG